LHEHGSWLRNRRLARVNTVPGRGGWYSRCSQGRCTCIWGAEAPYGWLERCGATPSRVAPHLRF
jgi:hypothetical protein